MENLQSYMENTSENKKEGKPKRNEEKIINVIFTKKNDNVEDTITIISELDRDFLISQKDDSLDKIKLENNNINKFKKQQINLKKKIVQNLEYFIKTNRVNKKINYNLINYKYINI